MAIPNASTTSFDRTQIVTIRAPYPLGFFFSSMYLRFGFTFAWALSTLYQAHPLPGSPLLVRSPSLALIDPLRLDSARLPNNRPMFYLLVITY
jgi:hypothetical protein